MIIVKWVKTAVIINWNRWLIHKGSNHNSRFLTKRILDSFVKIENLYFLEEKSEPLLKKNWLVNLWKRQ